jgi:hypothetical protein
MSLITSTAVLQNKLIVLAGNEIERGIVISMIESRANKISRDKVNGIRDYLNPQHRGSTDKYLCLMCESHYRHPGPAIDNRSERLLDHGLRIGGRGRQMNSKVRFRQTRRNLMRVENKLVTIGSISICPWPASPGPYI